MMNQLDTDLLRTFLAVADTGSITAGALRIGRSQSAASLQINRLETLLGKAVFDRHGRGILLNSIGEKLEPVARRAVMALDDCLAEIKSENLAGRIRIGIPDDHSKSVLSAIIAGFVRHNPSVEIAVRCALSADFSSAIRRGELDQAIHEVEFATPDMDIIHQEATYWVTSALHDVHARDPLPIALFDRECWWRDASIRALKDSGLTYRIVYCSESVTGVAAAIEAGVAVGLLGASSISENMCVLDQPQSFTAMPVTKLVLERKQGADSAVVQAMSRAIKAAFAQQQGMVSRKNHPIVHGFVPATD